MDIAELRATIWDDLFRSKSAKSIEEIAAHSGHDLSDVRMAVDHEWFKVNQDRVSVAMAAAHSYQW